MKHKNTDSGSPHNYLQDLAIFSLVVSLSAVAIAGIAIDIPFSEITRDVAYNRVMTIAGLVIGVLGVAATVYFVVVGIRIHHYVPLLENMEERFTDINAEVARNKEGVDAINSKDIDILDVMSLIEGSSKDENQKAVIRLATGRMICKSETHSDKYPLAKGIMYLGQYSRSQEDIDILEKIIAETDDKNIKKQAANAIESIKGKMGGD